MDRYGDSFVRVAQTFDMSDSRGRLVLNKLAFRTDPYGWNDAVAEKLGFSKGTGGRAKVGSIDVGP